MELPDALVHQCKNFSRLPDGEQKDELKQTAEEVLHDYEDAGRISADLRLLLLRILAGGD